MWYIEGSAFFITVISLSFGSIALCVRYCLRSKCSDVSCGCLGCMFNIHRNVEVKEDIELGVPPESVDDSV